MLSSRLSHRPGSYPKQLNINKKHLGCLLNVVLNPQDLFSKYNLNGDDSMLNYVGYHVFPPMFLNTTNVKNMHQVVMGNTHYTVKFSLLLAMEV